MNPPAGFWRRYAAYSLDAAAIALLGLPLLWTRLEQAAALFAGTADALLDQLWPLLDSMSAGAEVVPWDWLDLARDPRLLAQVEPLVGEFTVVSLQSALVLAAVAAVWFIPSEASRWQASPGKRLLGLRVTDLHGQRCRPGRIAARFLAGTPSWLLLNLGHAMAAIPPARRALHDYIAGTRVELAPGAAPAMPPAARGWLLLQAAVFCGLVGFVLLRYVQLLLEISRAGY